jgi:uncharacterized protein YbjT (DUF2867 family)
MTGRILVTGAGGTVGRLVVPLLVAAGAPVRAGLHDLHADPFETTPGVEPVVLDFDDPVSLDAAFDRVRAVYLVTPQTPDSVRFVRAAVAAAKKAGVQHVVRQSVYNAETGRDGIARWHRETEGLIRISGLRHTFLRPNSFMQNFLTIYRDSILQEGAFSLPLGRAALSSLDVRDLAAAAVAALTTERADREAYVLTGPEALTGRQFAEILARAIDRPIAYRNEPEDARRAPRTDAERAESEALRELGREMRAGELARVTRGVRELAGRAPISFERFVRDHLWAFVGRADEAGRAA